MIHVKKRVQAQRYARSEAQRHQARMGWCDAAAKLRMMRGREHEPGELRFPRLAMLGRVQSTTERDAKTEQETRYCLCSTKLDAKSFARALCGHCGIENPLHRVLDVVFRDDLTRLGSGNGPDRAKYAISGDNAHQIREPQEENRVGAGLP